LSESISGSSDAPANGSIQDCPDEELFLDILRPARNASSSDREKLLSHLHGCDSCRALASSLAEDAFEEQPGAAMMSLRLGELLCDRYEILSFVARGGMGEVYRAHDRFLNQTIALKTLSCTLLDSDDAITRLKSEVLLARQVTHANVCRILEFGVSQRVVRGGTSESIPFLTMPMLAGQTFKLAIREKPIAQSRAMSIFGQILDGLDAIHAAGVVHRDLKSDNIFLVRDRASDEERALLMDFGLAKSLELEHGRQLSVDKIMGTPDYMAPEQLQGLAATVRSDIYAMGIIMFEALTGRLPFQSSRPLAAAVARLTEEPPDIGAFADVSDACRKAVAKCLSRDPADRFPDARSLRTALLHTDESAPTIRVHSRRLLLLTGVSVVTAVLVSWFMVNAPRTQGLSPVLDRPNPPSKIANQETSTPGSMSNINAVTPPITPTVKPSTSEARGEPAEAALVPFRRSRIQRRTRLAPTVGLPNPPIFGTPNNARASTIDTDTPGHDVARPDPDDVFDPFKP
jgi:serine/threonine protein kinase